MPQQRRFLLLTEAGVYLSSGSELSSAIRASLPAGHLPGKPQVSADKDHPQRLLGVCPTEWRVVIECWGWRQRPGAQPAMSPASATGQGDPVV